jgi:hypothetical protein
VPKYIFYQLVLFNIQGLIPDSGVLPSGQPCEKEASKVYLSTKEIDAILRLMVENRINHLNEQNDLQGGKDDRNNSENQCSR